MSVLVGLVITLTALLGGFAAMGGSVAVIWQPWEFVIIGGTALGTFIVIGLYLLANVAYLVTLPFAQIQHAPADRVATATLNVIFPGLGATIMAIGIIISTFGCTNGLILAGARASSAMARDASCVSAW